ncbi:MAG: hypothetical protein QM500_02100 [Methylococcales bacterium]
MKFFILRTIILLLLLLQGFAPLVHAHVSGHGIENGFHIDGIDLQIEKSPQISSFENIYQTNIAISISGAVQQKNQLLTGLSLLRDLNYNKLVKYAVINKQTLFFSPVSSASSVVDLSSLAPRAPPFN